MSILIKRDNKGINKLLTAEDLVEGNAYMNEFGEVFICSRYKDIVGFSIAGNTVIGEECGMEFLPVDITITVHD